MGIFPQFRMWFAGHCAGTIPANVAGTWLHDGINFSVALRGPGSAEVVWRCSSES